MLRFLITNGLFHAQVDMTKVNLEVIKPWITQRVTEILGFEDDVVIEFIFNQLEEKVMSLIVFIFCSFRTVIYWRALLSA